jgi:endoglucanase
VHLGEFGAYKTADAVSRAKYYAQVRNRAEAANIGWCIWDWKAGFAYWGRSTNQPLPGVREALFTRR